jgi:hypothetical protein
MNIDYCDEVSKITKANFTRDMYVIAEMKQAIYRTQARLDKPIDIYLGFDLASNKEFTLELLNCLNINKGFNIKEILSFNIKLLNNKGGNNRIEDAIKLIESELVTDEMLLNKEINISLSDLFELIPRCKKETSRYLSLINLFKELNIKLNISTSR